MPFTNAITRSAANPPAMMPDDVSALMREEMSRHRKGMKMAETPGYKGPPKKKGAIKKTGTFEGKSNALGHGGRAAQLKAQGVPGGVIGELARKAHAAPGQKNYHGGKK